MSERDRQDGDVGGDTGETAGDKGANGGKALDEASMTSIEARLRTIYDEVASEPVPDRFMELLNQLERSEERKA